MPGSEPIKSNQCPNCEAYLNGENYCPNCGQKNDRRRWGLTALLREALANYFAADGRFWQTMKGLIFSPGKLPKEYLSGRRTRYMPPVRLFFLSAILLITVSNLFQLEADFIEINIDSEKAPSAVDSLSAAEIAARTAELKLDLTGQPHAGERFITFTKYLKFHHQHSDAEVFSFFELENNYWNRFLLKQARKLDYFNHRASDNYDSFNKALKNRLFWILFLFVPILSFWLWLFFRKNKLYYSEHLIFAFFQQSFFFILLTLYNLSFLPDEFLIIFLIGFGVHLYLSLKNFYGRRHWGTTWRFVLIFLANVISFVIFFIISNLVVFLSL